METRKRSSKTRKKKTKYLHIIVIVAIACLSLLAALIMEQLDRSRPSTEWEDSQKYFGVEQGGPVVVRDCELEHPEGLIRDGHFYLSPEYIRKKINSRFYFDETEQLLLYVLPDEILRADSSSRFEGSPILLSSVGKTYLLFDYIAAYSNIEWHYEESPERLVVRTDWAERTMVVVRNAETAVRTQADIKSPVRAMLPAGEEAFLLTSEKDWYLVGTRNGYSGYVLREETIGTRQVQESGPREEPVYTPPRDSAPVCLVWHQVFNSSGADELDALLSSADCVNTISPTWLRMTDTEGNLSSLADAAYVERAHAKGLQVWVLVNNMDEEIYNDELALLLNRTSSRTRLIENLMAQTLSCGADGINIDIESLPESAAYGYIQLIRELSVSCRREGLVLSVDNYVPSPWTRHYFRAEQAVMADYLIIMGYDEHTSGSDAGPTASLPFVISGVEDTLKEVPAGKIINAVPFYSRVWKGISEEVKSETITMAATQEYLSRYSLEPVWDDSVGQYYVEHMVDGERCRLWVEDVESMHVRLGALRDYRLAGIAAWKLGIETPSVWPIFRDYLGQESS